MLLPFINILLRKATGKNSRKTFGVIKQRTLIRLVWVKLTSLNTDRMLLRKVLQNTDNDDAVDGNTENWTHLFFLLFVLSLLDIYFILNLLTSKIIYFHKS